MKKMVYDLASLRQACEAGESYEYLCFWRATPNQDGSIGESCLSQWWPSVFTVDGVTYTFAEQYMMAEKARLFGDEEIRKAILASGHPKEMKALGRAVQGFRKEVWEARRYAIVLRGNLAKFSQDPALLAYLRSTAGRILVEASPMDRIWGIGMGKENPNAQDPAKWRGQNLLGFALTQAREELMEQDSV